MSEITTSSFPVVSPYPSVQAHYELMRANGESHLVAEMLALRAGPALLTDAVFLQGKGGCYDQFRNQTLVGQHYRDRAARAGVDVTGKVYLSGLAAFPGDPRAWVSGRGDVLRVCRERGWGCEGAVTLPVREVAEAWGPYRVADDLVAAKALDLREADPALGQEDALESARLLLSPSRTHAPAKE